MLLDAMQTHPLFHVFVCNWKEEKQREREDFEDKVTYAD